MRFYKYGGYLFVTNGLCGKLRPILLKPHDGTERNNRHFCSLNYFIMRKIFTLSFLLVSLAALAGPFTPGNIVVVRVGNGGATALTSAAAPVFLEEYTIGGGLVQTIALPTTVSGANKALTMSGSSTSDGNLNLSVDRSYLTLTGYDAAVATAAVTGTASMTINRVVAVVDASGNVNTTTALTDAYSGSNIRSAVTTNGTDIWLAGTSNPTGTGGPRYTTKGATNTTQLLSTITNVRTVSIYNGQLYCSSATGTYLGVSSIGTGLPTTSGQTITYLPGFPTVASSPTQSPYGFEINPGPGNTMYLADDRTVASGGGIQKWTLAAGTWSLAYTIAPDAILGARGLTVDWRTATPIIYATTSGNSLVAITDNGSAASSTLTPLITAGTNTVFRGVAFAPGTPTLPVSILSFDAQKANGKNELVWKVAQETDFNYYEVERSIDGRTYSSIGKVNAVNNSTYTFTDAKPASLNYYRIKLVDKNGKFNFTKVVVVVNKDNGFAVGNVYPTITKDIINVEVYAAANTRVQYTINSLSGQKMMSKSAVVSQFAKQTFDISSLAAGMYLLQISGSDGQKTIKVIKQ